MRQMRARLRWFQTLPGSVFLFVSVLLLVIAYGTALFIATDSSPVLAQEPTPAASPAPAPSVVSKPESEPPKAEAPVPAQAAPAKPASPRVKKAPAAPTPAPAYDKITISSIGLSSRYVSVSRLPNNAIDVHPTLVGMYDRTASPGGRGAVFLDGHNPGVFSTLPSIGIGAIITLTKANGEVFNYQVVHVETVQLVGIDMKKALSAYGGAREGLNLMTCVGTYNKSTGTTDQRFVVYALRA